MIDAHKQKDQLLQTLFAQDVIKMPNQLKLSGNDEVQCSHAMPSTFINISSEIYLLCVHLNAS